MIYSTLTWGLVCLKFWSWFILPIFPELPVITYAMAVGLIMFIGLFRGHSVTMIKEHYRDMDLEFILLVIAPWLTLIIGWITFNIIY